MALSASTLESMIIAELNAQGIVTEGEHAKAAAIAVAVSKSVVAHIQSAALVTVAGGSSAGAYKVS